MINLNEIRLGNLIQHVPLRYLAKTSVPKELPGGIAGPFEVLKIHPEHLTAKNLKSGLPFGLNSAEVEGIALTDERLEKLGFTRRLEDFFKIINPWSGILIIKAGKASVCAVNSKAVEFTNPIRYIHQLQNLFFDITGVNLDVQNLLK